MTSVIDRYKSSKPYSPSSRWVTVLPCPWWENHLGRTQMLRYPTKNVSLRERNALHQRLRSKRVRLVQETQMWVEVSTMQQGKIRGNPYTPWYTKSMCLAGTEVANVQPDQPFRILIANVGGRPIYLHLHQVVGTAAPHREKRLESIITCPSVRPNSWR